MGRILALLVVLILSKSTKAEENIYQFSCLDIANGLSDNQVNAIYKDRTGFIWIGTMMGLNRYDGQNFKIFRHNSKDSTTLLNDYIINIFEGPEKYLWIETGKGFCIYNPVSEKFERLNQKHFKKYDVPLGEVRAIKTDNIGRLYFDMMDRGIFCYDAKSKKTTLISNLSGQLYSTDISNFTNDTQGNLWIIYRNGVLDKFDLKKHKVVNRYFTIKNRLKGEEASFGLKAGSEGEIFIYNFSKPFGLFYLNRTDSLFRHIGKGRDNGGLNSDNVSELLDDKEGNIWVGTDHGGINIINKKTGKVSYILSDERNKRSLPQNTIRVLYRDNDELIWIGTYKKGLGYYHKSIFKFPADSYVSKVNATYKDINCFAEDKQGNLWIGTNDSGLLFLNRATGEIKSFRHNPNNKNSLSSDIVVRLCIDHNGIVWIGTYLGGLDAFDGTNFTHYRHNQNPGSLADDRIFALLEDSSHRLWVGTLSGGLDLFEPNSKTFRHFNPGVDPNLYSYNILDICEDRNKNIWVGTAFGLYKLDSKTLTFTGYLSNENDSNSLIINYINSICEDSRGWLWLGTREGISIYNPATGKFRNLSEESGLPENTIFELQEDENHNMWYSSSNGLYKISVSEQGSAVKFSYCRYNETDGLQGRQFNSNAALKTKRGELIFGGASGFNIFRAGAIDHQNHHAPLVLTELDMFNRRIAVGDSINGRTILSQSITQSEELVLRHKENVFSLEFALLDFYNSNRVTYKYNLEGFDKRWLSVPANLRKATFTNLDPGSYIFHVKAFVGDNPVPINGGQIKITILPPFWRSNWAYFLYICVFGSLLWYIRNRGINKLKRKFALEQERTQARQLIEQERKEAQRRQELDFLKIKFLTNLSHEFRTPISLILAPLDKLLESKGKESYGQLSMIKRNARRLLNLVNQLLDFRKMEEHELKLNKSDGDLVAFVKEASDSFWDLAERKQIQLSFSSTVEQLKVSFDQDKIERVIFNLLSNAFKFTTAGGKVSVELTQLPTTAGEDLILVEIRIIDTGIGIPKDKQEKIFERFFQNENSSAILNQGTGIGLSITEEFVRMHNGEITVESTPGEGTCFTVHLRFSSSSVAIEPPTQAESENNNRESFPVTDARKRKMNAPVILLIEDNDDFRFYLKDNLKSSFKILEAVNGREGWQKALASHPQLIVSDINMPEMDGVELSKKLKSDKRTKHIPVILLTALTGEREQLKGLSTGANDYMTKPFNFEILHSKIKNLLTLHQTFKKTYSRQINVKAPELDVESGDVVFVNKMLKYIEDNLHNPQLSVEDLSQHLGQSRVSLYKKCLNITGKTPVDFIRTVKLEKAVALMEKSDKTIAEICYTVGFSTPNYFAKSFRAKYNMLPSEYRTLKRDQL